MEAMNIRLAIQRSGRLSDDSVRLIRDCGIKISPDVSKLKSPADNFPIEVLYLRDDDIPGYVAGGTADAGFVGENMVAEKGKPVRVVEKLGFGKCRLSIALPKTACYGGLKDLAGVRIATSYPRLLADFLGKSGIKASIHEISGSVEIAPGIGLADAVCDLVNSGSTLVANGLKEVEVIRQCEAVLIANQDLPREKQATLDELLFRIKSVLRARSFRYILLNVPDTAIARVVEVIPGMKSPTIMPLALKGWSSLHSVVREDDVWIVIEKLKEVGAEGILVLPIEKSVL